MSDDWPHEYVDAVARERAELQEWVARGSRADKIRLLLSVLLIWWITGWITPKRKKRG